jgi:hypothetical protein
VLNKTIIINQAPDTLTLALIGEDYDELQAPFDGVQYVTGPSDNNDIESNVAKAEIDLSQFPGKMYGFRSSCARCQTAAILGDLQFEGQGIHLHHARLKSPDDQKTIMQDTINGIVPFIIFMALVFAASRVLARFTGAKYSNALTPLAPIINGAFDTDSLSHGWLTGTYRDRKVGVASTPGVNEMSGIISPNNTGKAHRYNAFDVEVQDVAGEATGA